MSGAIPPSGTTPPMESFCIQVPLSSEWLGLVSGALIKLTYGYYWDKSIEGWEDAQSVGKAIFESWRAHNPCVAELVGTENCTDFPLSSGFINYYPLSPYLSPDITPDGWSNPPFGFANGADLLLGYQEGDILVTGFPNPTSGDLTLPSITFNLTGDGTIELHMLLVPNGGQAMVTIDGDLLNSRVFDLNADLVSLPAETTALEITHEVTFQTTGDHNVEVRFPPVLDDAFIPIRFGGGVRAVVLCGFDEMSLDIRTDPANDCLIQKTYDGTAWEDVIDVNDCATAAITNTITNKQGKVWRTSGGVTQYSDDDVTYVNYTDDQAEAFGMPDHYPDGVPMGVNAPCIAAKNVMSVTLSTMADLSKQISVGASITSVIGAIMGIVAAIFTAGLAIPAAVVGLAGLTTNAGNNFFTSLFTSEVTQQMECDLYETFDTEGAITTGQFAELLDLWTSRGTAVWLILAQWLRTLGPIGLAKIASTSSGGVDDCDNEPCDDTVIREYDFKISPNPFSPALKTHQEQVLPPTQGDSFVEGNALWVAQKGYKDYTQVGINSGTGRYYPHARIKYYIPHAITLTRVDLTINWKKSSTLNPSVRPLQIIVWSTAGTQLFLNQFDFASSYADGVFVATAQGFSWSIPALAEIQIRGSHLSQDTAPAVPPYDGWLYIEKAKFYGTE